MKKLLVLGIIFLFIGIAVAPSVTSIDITESKTSKNDLVEINVQICKTDGVENHKMFITQEQDEQLDVLIENQKEKLFNAESTDETTKIHKEMIISLYELGILSSENKNSILSDIYNYDSKLSRVNIFKNILKHKSLFPKEIFNYKSSRSNKIFNVFCTVSYSATITYARSHFFLKFFYRVGFGGTYFAWNGDYGDIPAVGYVNTDGIFGIQNYEGKFYGKLGSFFGPPPTSFIESMTYDTGIRYFSGVVVNKVGKTSYGQGTALSVKI